MNLLIVSTVDFNKHGIPVAIMNNYRQFDHTSIHCTFVTYDSVDDFFEKEIRKNGDDVCVLSHRKKDTFKYIKELRSLAISKKFDLAHIHGNSSTMVFELIALKGMVKTVCEAHNTDCVHSFLHRALYPLFFCMVEERAACTKEAGVFLYNKRDFQILKNGIDSNEFKFSQNIRERIRKEMAVDDEFVILHVGAFNEQKNHQFIIDLFGLYKQTNPNSKLWLIGEGNQRESIIFLSRKNDLEDSVSFVGKIDNVSEYMMAADCFILPSLYESFGIVNIEAQATGLPCIVSKAVPDASKISDYFFKESLYDMNNWVNALNICKKLTIQREQSYLNVLKQGFDVKQTSKELLAYYRGLR